jgi:cytochrome c oxidase assembly protein subunit 15
MVKTIADAYQIENKSKKKSTKFVVTLLSITLVQMVFAGLMSGMKAGLYYPTWPSMNGKLIPEVLINTSNWSLHNLTNYDNFEFAPALIQFIHRLLAYIILALMVFYYYKKRNHLYTRAIKWLTISYVLILVQIFLGISVLIKIKTGIPLFYGVLHQLTGLLFFISLLFLYYSLRKKQLK